MEETVRELKEDFKNAMELIICLTENVKASKPERDEELHRKLDEILSQRDKQNELEMKMDTLREDVVESRKEIEMLREEVKSLVDDARNSKEVKHIIDSVETSVGYLELFAKDFDNIQLKIEEMNAGVSSKMGKIAKELNAFKKESTIIQQEAAHFGEKLDSFKDDLFTLIRDESAPLNKIDKLETDLNRTMEAVLRIEDMVHKEMDSNNVENETEDTIEEAEEYKKNYYNMTTFTQRISPAGYLKCRMCYNVLPKHLPLMKDGVSVQCMNCLVFSIVGRLREGHKWMCSRSISKEFCFHFQQFPFNTKENERATCQICGIRGSRKDASILMALPC